MKLKSTYITTLNFMDNIEKRFSKELYNGECYATAVRQAEHYRSNNEEQTLFHHYCAKVEECDGRTKAMLQYRVYLLDGRPNSNWVNVRTPSSNKVM